MSEPTTLRAHAHQASQKRTEMLKQTASHILAQMTGVEDWLDNIQMIGDRGKLLVDGLPLRVARGTDGDKYRLWFTIPQGGTASGDTEVTELADIHSCFLLQDQYEQIEAAAETKRILDEAEAKKARTRRPKPKRGKG